MENRDKKWKTIGIIGSRRRNSDSDFEKLKDVFFSNYKEGDRIVSGGCPKGGDRFAEIIAKTYQIPIMIYYANWNKLGKRAGFSRNTNIAEDADVIIAIVSKDRTGGAEDTIKKAINMGKEIILIEEESVSELKPDLVDYSLAIQDIQEFDPLVEEC